MNNTFKLTTVFAIFVTWGMQLFHIAYLGVLLGIIAPSPISIAFADQTFINSIYDDYDFDSNRLQLAQLDEDRSNLEGYLIQKSINRSPVPPTDYSRYNSPITGETLDKSAKNARAISSQVAAPVMDGQGRIESSYKTKGKTDIQTNSEGKVEIQARSDQGSDGANIEQREFLGEDADSPEITFDAPSTYGDNNAFINSGKQTRSRLETGNTQDAKAYQTLMNSYSSNPKRDISPFDPVFTNGANEIKRAAEGQGEWFMDCQNVTTTRQQTVHVPDWQDTTCKQPKRDNPVSCELSRDLHVPIYLIGGTGEVEMCGPNCVKLTIEQREDNSGYTGELQLCKLGGKDSLLTVCPGQLPAQCKQRTNAVRLKFDEEISITSAVIKSARWDDNTQVKLGNSPIMTFNGDSSGSSLPTSECETLGIWDLPQAGVRDVDITAAMNDELSTKADRIIQFSQSVSYGGIGGLEYDEAGTPSFIGGSGEAKVEIEIHFSGDFFNDEHIQTPELCYDKVIASNGICSYESIEAIEVGTHGLHQSILNIGRPLYPGDTGNLTWKANLKGYFCDPLKNQPLTVTLDDGTVKSLNYNDIRTMPDNCMDIKTNPACYKKSETCTEGWFDDGTNECYMKTVEYSCDVGVSYTRNVSTTTNTCAGLLNCSGGDCFNFGNEVNNDFDRAAAMLQVANNMNGDAECEDPNDPSTCRVFNGEPKYCSWASWISESKKSDFGANCCIAPDGINFMDYLSAGQTMYMVSEWTATSEMVPEMIQGAWKNVHEPIANGISSAGEMMSNAWSNVTDSFANAADMFAGNAAGTSGGTLVTSGTDAVAQGGEELAQSFGLDTLKQEAMNYAYELMGPDLGGVFFEPVPGQVGQVALTSGMQTVASIVSAVMWVYAAYQFVKLALNLLTACDDNEKDMGLRIALKQCFKTSGVYCGKKILGICVKDRRKYCCYDSILSRIIMKQAYEQVGFKDDCSGLTPLEISQLDWSQIDLSEWIALMQQGDFMPTGAEDFTQDALTGTGRMLNSDTRENIEQRMENRLDGTDLQDRANEAREFIKPENLDCSQVPRPSACDWN